MQNRRYDIQTVFKDKDIFLKYYNDFMNIYYGRNLEDSNDIQKYLVLAKMVKTCTLNGWRETKLNIKNSQSKQLYYFSLEFLLGRMLRNNLISLGIYDIVKKN